MILRLISFTIALCAALAAALLITVPAQAPIPSAITEVAGNGTTTVQEPVAQVVAEVPVPQQEPAPAAVETAATTEAPPVAQTPQGPTDAELNSSARAALVNIFCTTRQGGAFKPLSGSGVVIDSRGVILTNAHIAQYLLLRDYPTRGNIDCTIRGGSPAVPLYDVMVLYVSPAWIADNAKKIGQDGARGTGENDFALLVAKTNGPIPALAYKKTVPATGERMLLAAYPAGFLSGEVIATNLYPTSAFVAVNKKYTFGNTSQTDLFSVGGSVVSQSGSSGGAAVRMDGTLAGIISTAVLEGTTGERDLRAITVAHIERSLAAAGLGSLAKMLEGNVQSKAITFESDVAPGLADQLIAALQD